MHNKCLLVGASGLIGNNLLARLQSYWRVVYLSRNISKIKSRKNIRGIKCDLTGKFDINLLPKKIGAVIYLAQSPYFKDFPKRACDIFQVNTVGVLRFLEYAKKAGVKIFILASSGGVDRIIDGRLESNLGFYYTTKLCSEMLAKNYSAFMNIIILRPFFVYGSGQRKNMLIPRLIDSIKQGKPILLDGKDGIKINPIHVSDVANAITKALSLKGQHTIDIAGPRVYTMRRIGEIIGKKLNKKPIFKIKNERDSCDFIGDISRMTKFLRAPCVTFEQGIGDLI